MLSQAHDFKFADSKLLELDTFGQGKSIWTCQTKTSGGICFWVGNLNGDELEFFAYLGLAPRDLSGLPVLEAKKGWTEAAWRGKGFGRSLLEAAAKAAPLLSDLDGMTDMAYHQWRNAPGFRRRWWDMTNSRFVDEDDVPTMDQFDHYENAKRWAIVMDQSH